MLGVLGLDPLDPHWAEDDRGDATHGASSALVDGVLDAASGRPRPARLRGCRRDPRPAHRCRACPSRTAPTARLVTRRTCRHIARQFQTSRRHAQGRHQEGHGRRFRRAAPPRPAGQGTDAARRDAPRPSRGPQGGETAASAGKSGKGGGGSRTTAGNRRRPGDGETPETVVGRNPVVEVSAQGCLPPRCTSRSAPHRRAGGRGGAPRRRRRDLDPGGSPPRPGPDRRRGAAPGPRAAGAALRVRAPRRAAGDRGRSRPSPALIVALDGVTDPRNLGAVVRSVGAFGGHGVVVPQRRAAGMTAVAWRTSAGTAARLPVARATNLTRTLREYAKAGFMVAGLDADGAVVARRLRARGRSVGARHRFGGQGPLPAGEADLRRHGLDPDGGAGRVAERLGGRRRRPGRDRAPAPPLNPGGLRRRRRGGCAAGPQPGSRRSRGTRCRRRSRIPGARARATSRCRPPARARRTAQRARWPAAGSR